MKADTMQILGFDSVGLEKTGLTHIGLSGCINIMDACILNVVHECCKLSSIDLNECQGLTDAGTLLHLIITEYTDMTCFYPHQ